MAIFKFKIFEKLWIVFYKNETTLFSNKKLKYLLDQTQSQKINFESDTPPIEGYLLVEKKGMHFDFIPTPELEEWKKDGSIEQGDILYKINLMERY